ncbi:restriction endonuclease subunit S [Pseudoalteromonas sp. YIC-827]|uniref:Restriction endonuclease subunit S n=1 Tax=Pseudoalteromonas qingdaonensis TaxID=3131913 RepID=A0ABU9MVD9_9GAMM
MSWPIFKLGDLVTIKGGGTPSKKVEEYWNGDIPWASVKDLKGSEISSTADFITEAGVKNSATNLIPAGTILTATRMALGRFVVNSVDMAINQDLKALFINDSSVVERNYLIKFLSSKAKYIEGEGKGATVKGITLDFLKDLQIPLPPLEEQKRIAAILDKADSVRRKRQQAIDLADDFLRSVFLDMFGDPVTNPKGWKLGSFSDISAINPKAEKYDDDLPVSFVPMPSVSEDSHVLDASDIRPYSEVRKGFTAFKEGDVLFAKITPCMENGKAAIATGLKNETGFGSTEFHVFRPDNSNYAPFIYSLIHLPLFRKIAASNFSGAVGHKRVPKDFLSDFKLILPPIELVLKFKTIFEAVNQSKAKYSAYKSESSELFNSLSQKAFAGDL